MPQIQAGEPSPNFFLDGNFSPVFEERDTDEMEVVGKIPDALQGHFLRVPNPSIFSETAYHTFDGDGMIHAIEFIVRSLILHRHSNEGFELEQARGDWVKGMNSLMDLHPQGSPKAHPAPKPREYGLRLSQQHPVCVA